MSIVVPIVGKDLVLSNYLNATLTLSLFGNNLTPDRNTTLASITEVTGGGFVPIPLLFANWVITSGSPSRAQYNTKFTIQFTGPVGGLGTVYGYYVKDSLGNLRWLERFPTASIPYVPINGSLIKIRPRFSVASIFGD